MGKKTFQLRPDGGEVSGTSAQGSFVLYASTDADGYSSGSQHLDGVGSYTIKVEAYGEKDGDSGWGEVGTVTLIVSEEVEVMDVTFSEMPIPADGVSTTTASATTNPPSKLVDWSIEGETLGASIDSQGTITAGTIHGEITIRATDTICQNSHAENKLRLVKVDKIQYEGPNGFTDAPDPLIVKKGDTLNLKAFAKPNGDFPAGYPIWGGEVSGTGESTVVTFSEGSSSMTDYKIVSASCGNTHSINVIVDTYQEGELPSGIIRNDGGDLFVEDNAWYMVYGGTVNLSAANMEDKDWSVLQEDYVEDTFIDEHAFFWRTSSSGLGGSCTPEYGVNTVFTAPVDENQETCWVELQVLDDGEFYQDFSTLTALQSVAPIHLFGYVGVESVTVKDGPNRTSNNLLEVAGTTTVTLEATPESGGSFQDGYPIWTMNEETKEGETVTFSCAAPTAFGFSPNNYTITCVGEPEAPPIRVAVKAYATNEKSLTLDFKKLADKINDKIKTFDCFSNSENGTITVKWPKGTASSKVQFQELSHSHLVILSGELSAGLNPVIGIEADIQLYGLPDSILGFFSDDAKAGVYLTMGSEVNLNGGLSREPNESGTAATYTVSPINVSGVITGGLKAELEASKYVMFGVIGSTSVSVGAKVLIDATGLGRKYSASWGGLDVTVKGKVKIIWDWEYSQTWHPIQSVAIIDPNSPVSYWVVWGGN